MDRATDTGQRIAGQATARTNQLRGNPTPTQLLALPTPRHCWLQEAGNSPRDPCFSFSYPSDWAAFSNTNFHFWPIRPADSHCFVPLLKHRVHIKHTSWSTSTWWAASWLHPLLRQPLHCWVCCLQQWLGWWIPSQLLLKQGNHQNLGQKHIVCSASHHPLVSEKGKN